MKHYSEIPKWFLFAAFIASVLPSSAQELSLRMASSDTHINPSSTGQLSLVVDNLSFFKDNEFEGEQAKGYSLPGFWVQPKLNYQPLSNVRLEAGFHALIFDGANKYPCYAYHDIGRWKGNQYQSGAHLLPFFRAQAQLNRVTLVLGDIFGGANHRVMEPLMNPEVNLTQDPEMGFQLLVDLPRYQLDAWVNWQSYIFEEDTHQEAFTVGFHQRISLNSPLSTLNSPLSTLDSPLSTLNSPLSTLDSRLSTLHSRLSTLNSPLSTLHSPLSTLNWYLSLDVLIQHRGGEQDITDMGVQTITNGGVGVGLLWNARARLLQSLNAEVALLGCWQQAGKLWPFDKGAAASAMLSAQLRGDFRVFGGLFYARDFVSLYGAPFYSTLSQKIPGARFKSMLTPHMGVEWSHTFSKSYILGLKADAYPLFAGQLKHPDGTAASATFANNFSFGVYFRCNPSFLLKK